MRLVRRLRVVFNYLWAVAQAVLLILEMMWDTARNRWRGLVDDFILIDTDACEETAGGHWRL